MYTSYDKAILFVDSFSKIEYKNKLLLLENVESLQDIFENLTKNANFILQLIGEKSYNLMVKYKTEEYVNYLLQGLEKRGIKIISQQNEFYPQLLKETKSPPLLLYAKGNLQLLKEQLPFAMVGSRHSTPFSLKLASEYAKELTAHNFTIITGLAEGVDSAVIEGAMKSKKIISVLPCGFDNIYPSNNRDLFDKVCENGLALSEFHPGVITRNYFFMQRNRIIAGLSLGVLVCSASKRSGTSYTASSALDNNRDVFAFPYNIAIESGEGCNNLIKDGAYMVTELSDILNIYNIKENESKQIDLSDSELQVLNFLKNGEVHIEKIREHFSKTVEEISIMLTFLEIKGLIVKSAGNFYCALK